MTSSRFERAVMRLFGFMVSVFFVSFGHHEAGARQRKSNLQKLTDQYKMHVARSASTWSAKQKQNAETNWSHFVEAAVGHVIPQSAHDILASFVWNIQDRNVNNGGAEHSVAFWKDGRLSIGKSDATWWLEYYPILGADHTLLGEQTEGRAAHEPRFFLEGEWYMFPLREEQLARKSDGTLALKNPSFAQLYEKLELERLDAEPELDSQ